MLTYFLALANTHKGLGTLLLGRLTEDTRKAGMKVLVANISSRKEAGIQFHTWHGFRRARNPVGIGEKFGITLECSGCRKRWIERREFWLAMMAEKRTSVIVIYSI
ncbi:MAG: hypothetical protein QHG99_08885 [Methanomicrobiales archaeon]|nr:hypothetical protein [Methanomicrobiales archaeon]